MIVPLFGTSAGYKSSNVSMQRRVNLYIEPQKDQDKAPFVMYGTPGLTLFADLGALPARGGRAINNTAYTVHGATLYAVNNAGAYTAVGVLATNGGRVGMTDNGTQLLIVDGVGGYIYNVLTGVFAVIADPAFPNGATTCTFLNGFFVVNKPGTGQFWWSAIYNGLVWNALQFATAESSPDNLVAVSADHGELLLYGDATTEFWGASGDSAVWRRIGGAGIEWGLPAPWSLARFGDGEIFLAKNRMGQFQVVVLRNYQVQPVSTPDVTQQLNQRTNIAGATAYSYLLDGHPFYQINFTDKSFLYDGLADAWSEVSSGLTGGRHYGEIRFELLSIPYASDYRSGKLYKVDVGAYTDAGDQIAREWITRHTFKGLDYLSIAELQVEFEAGVGLNAGQGSNPQCMLQVSKDGGHTWGNERWQAMGAQGKYAWRSVWYLLGVARDWLFKFRITDPVKVVVINGLLVAD